ncbi:MAG: hypothetical protein M0P49_03610 [Bacilli bacterium]|nr:hypothetical protein [Bacilli bacterium]
MGRVTTEFPRIISIRVPDINKNQTLLKNYYYTIIEKFLPKSKKNIESLKFVFDEVENFFIVINNIRFIIKYGGIFYDNIKEFEDYMFEHILSVSMFNMDVNLTPVMITKEDKEKILQELNKIEEPELYNNYQDMVYIYNDLDNYFVLNIMTNNNILVLDEIQN